MSRAIAKRPISLSIDADLIDEALAYGVDVSAVAEEALRALISRESSQAWLNDNREAIAAQNAWAAERGLFSDEFRGW